MVALPVFIAFRGVCVDQQKIKNKQQIKNVVDAVQNRWTVDQNYFIVLIFFVVAGRHNN